MGTVENKRYEVTDDSVSYSDFLKMVENRLDPNANSVLLVDDERGIRRKVARDIQEFAPKVLIHEAGNGKEAIEQLAAIRKKYTHDPLFIVLDLNMPVMNGWELIEALKKEYQAHGKTTGIPIIVLSSTSGETGILFGKKSVHGGKAGYKPLITVAKENCTDARRYDGVAEKHLMGWLRFFAKAK